MSYSIKLRDRREIIVPTDAGQALKEHLLKLKSAENVEIAGDLIRSSEIVSITKINLSSEAYDDSHSLPQAKYNCVLAGTSIQYAIHQIARKQYPKDWPKYVQDKDWRAKTRLAIRAKYPNRKWCDHQLNEHHCLSVSKDIANVAVVK